MSQPDPSSPPLAASQPQRDSQQDALRARALFGLAMIRVGIAVGVGVVILAATYKVLPWQIPFAAVIGISLGCGIVSLAAASPGWMAGRTIANQWLENQRNHGTKSETVAAGKSRKLALVKLAAAGGMVAMAIRSLGTIALFVGCSYQFAQTAEQVAFLTIGWYLIATTIEVLSLVNVTRRLDESHQGCQSVDVSADLTQPTPNSSLTG